VCSDPGFTQYAITDDLIVLNNALDSYPADTFSSAVFTNVIDDTRFLVSVYQSGNVYSTGVVLYIANLADGTFTHVPFDVLLTGPHNSKKPSHAVDSSWKYKLCAVISICTVIVIGITCGRYWKRKGYAPLAD